MRNYFKIKVGAVASILCIAVLARPAIGLADENCADDHGPVDFSLEPTVTKEESLLLNAALEVASTNALRAIQMLH